MELERLIGFVNEKLGGGDDLETIIAEFIDMGLCAPEQTAQLREHFAPPAVKTSTPSPLPSAPEPTQAANPSERSVPTLQIDWGMGLKPGVPLVPKFTIKGSQRPLVYLRIPQIGLKQVPTLKNIANDWYFFLHLQIDKPGQYLCQIVAIDQTSGFSDPEYYYADFCIDVADPKEAGQRRKVTIHADENLTANLNRFGKDADIEIVGKNVALMARDESLVDQLAEASKKLEPNGISDSTTTIPFLSDENRAKRVPYLSQQADAPRRVRRLTMTESSGTKHFVLIGGHSLSFGRDDPDRRIQNDVPLEILPRTQEEGDRANEFALVGGLFSRTHASLEVDTEGVHLLDCREGGINDATILDHQALKKKKRQDCYFPTLPIPRCSEMSCFQKCFL